MLPSIELAIEGAIVVGLFGLFSYKIGMVDPGGLVAGLIIGYATYFFGGRFLFLPLITFHLTAGIFTKYKFELKRSKGVAEEKRGARGWRNVAANGAVAAFFAFLTATNNSPMYVVAFLGAVSTAAADTLATEIGLLYRGEPRLITNFTKKVPAGTPGGVTILGEVAQVIASIFIAVATVVMAPMAEKGRFAAQVLTITIFSGFIGSTFDSLLGATVQRVFRCRACGRVTEKRIHCGHTAKQIRGWTWVDNNVVNVFAISVGAAVAVFLQMIGLHHFMSG